MPSADTTSFTDPYVPSWGIILSPEILVEINRQHTTLANACVYAYVDSVTKANNPWVGCQATVDQIGFSLRINPDRVDAILDRLVRDELLVCLDLHRRPKRGETGRTRRAFAPWNTAADWYYAGIKQPIRLGGKKGDQ